MRTVGGRACSREDVRAAGDVCAAADVYAAGDVHAVGRGLSRGRAFTKGVGVQGRALHTAKCTSMSHGKCMQKGTYFKLQQGT